MKRICPNPDCNSMHIIKKGFSPRRISDGYKAQKFLCKSCGKRFSSATSDPCFGQNKRHLNAEIQRLLASGMSRNNIASLVGVHQKTVQRKLKFLGMLSKSKNDNLLAEMKPVSKVQFDEMETFEHTKLKPVAIALSVVQETRIILGYEISQIPANGPLAAESVEKYGHRKDKRRPAMRKMLAGIAPLLANQVLFESDKATWYPDALKAVFSSKTQYTKVDKSIKYHHKTYKGRKSSNTGQGELKKGRNDPLFPLNHTAAMFRYNMSRLIRRTWCTTKRVENLVYHLNIYAYHHNFKRLNDIKRLNDE